MKNTGLGEPMISAAQFAARWGEQGLVRATPQALADVRMPDESKAFLIQAGLPGEAEGVGLSFSLPPDRLPTLREVLAAEGRPAPAGLERYRRIGNDYDAHLCIDQARGGPVVSVSVEPKLQVTFVNSSVPQLAEFLLRFRDLRRGLQAAEREAMRTVVEETRRAEEATPEQREAARGARLDRVDEVREELGQQKKAMQAVITGLREDLRAIDPAAIGDEESLWAVTLEEMEVMEGLR